MLSLQALTGVVYGWCVFTKARADGVLWAVKQIKRLPSPNMRARTVTRNLLKFSTLLIDTFRERGAMPHHPWGSSQQETIVSRITQGLSFRLSSLPAARRPLFFPRVSVRGSLNSADGFALAVPAL